MAEKRSRKGSQTSHYGTASRISHDSSAYYNTRLYEELKTHPASEPPVETPLPAVCENAIFSASAEDMSALPDNCVHLMVTSPPYNVTKEYDADLSLDEYLGLLKRVFSETRRVLVDGGRACVNVANLGRRPYIPLSDHISHLMIDLGFSMRGEVIWSKGAGAGVSMAWGSWQSPSNPVLRDTHEYILIFSKGTYKRDKSDGKESTISGEDFMEWTKSVWSFNPESARKIGHPAPFPLELPHRLIQLYTYRGEVVLDPFMGSGTTALAALKAGRRYVGYEVNPDYVRLSEARLAEARLAAVNRGRDVVE